ncbi:DUF6895 family protein [Actinoalloteichus hymeniacidonis]|uniref:DUF6895 domain-containing protein n=1 Tax=Actinoalloteichus hymeniacidonis TaxID=340345 RepID=A0AAC9MYP0_9PSEU|nr:hypothetical protein [Actinoalloteichus hymeniacidonis]AOS63659.1 hypothetical protein TL08_14225 [Actinoalloteichus hymeniacidonis]MBB5908293.1 hypothetical protein [Actinoalloteichus hymeniacidonis]
MNKELVALGHHLAGSAFGWLSEAAPHFRLVPDLPATEVDIGDSIKPLSELALAGSLAVREGVAGSREAQIAPEIVDFAWREFGCGSLLLAMQRRAPGETYPMETYAPFARAGRRNRDLDELLVHLAGLRAARVPELMPNRLLAVAGAQRIIGLPQHIDRVGALARTWLGGRPEPWTIDFLTAYAVTHTVFHVTDWGAHPAELPVPLQNYLHRWLPAWLEVYREARQWDLVGELLLVDLCLESPSYPVSCWTDLAEAQRPDGLLPYGPLPAPRRVAEAFRSCYHPTVVAAIAGTLLVSRGITALIHTPQAAGGVGVGA